MLQRRIVIVLASGAGLGYSPLAPGTVGTLYGVALYPVFESLRLWSTALYVVTFVGFVALSIVIADEAERVFGEKDAGRITIDEAAGYLAATLFLPLTWTNLVLAFFAFRLFDIVKPWPASWFDRGFRGGAGVVLDDVVAGVYANLLVRALLLLASAGAAAG